MFKCVTFLILLFNNYAFFEVVIKISTKVLQKNAPMVRRFF